MKNIVIIGGSKGIGNAITSLMVGENKIINISRSAPTVTHPNLKHYELNVLEDELPEIDEIDVLIYCPGSINLKPIMSLSIDDFRNDFEINVIGAVKAIQKYLPALKKGNNPSILLFSTVAAKLGMPFHASIATAKSGVEGLVKSLGAELAPTIRVNAIAPTINQLSSQSTNICYKKERFHAHRRPRRNRCRRDPGGGDPRNSQQNHCPRPHGRGAGRCRCCGQRYRCRL